MILEQLTNRLGIQTYPNLPMRAKCRMQTDRRIHLGRKQNVQDYSKC
jgi:hypothetical protein